MSFLLERLTAEVKAPELSPIDWPAGLAPTPVKSVDRDSNNPLPTCDVLLWVYTVAETQALADVFTPGLHWRDWQSYTHHFSTYETELTGRSPAREEKCAAYWWMTQVGDKRVIVMKNNFHLATDSTSLPLRRFWKQIIQESQPKMIIDSGTAGGIGAQMYVGDTVAATALQFDCMRSFRNEPFAKSRYTTTVDLPDFNTTAVPLMQSNVHLLRPQTEEPVVVYDLDVLTTDTFAEDTSDDKYGLRAFNANAGAVEMDASVLGLVAQDLGEQMPKFTSLRSVSDPQMPAGASEEAASKIYLTYGYAAQVLTCIAAHAVITQ